MVRFLSIFVITVSVLTNIGCSNNSEPLAPESTPVIADTEFYTFTPDDRYYLGSAQALMLPHNISVKDVLDTLSVNLATTYFFKTFQNELSGIRFEVISVDEIPTLSRPVRIAVVNMLDPKRVAMGHYFQGSCGGAVTFAMLAATFIQPHLDPPLLDGLILLYNGEMLPDLDHINLNGILIPRMVDGYVSRAIRESKK